MTFEEQLISLCRILETWRAECKTEAANDWPEFRAPKWRTVGYSVIFYALGQVAILEQSRLRYLQGIPTLVFYMVILAICSGTCITLAFHACGLMDRRFWRAAKLIFKEKAHYPFTQLIRNIENDSAAAKKLLRFPDGILVAAHERMGAEETELRDRLTILLGQPSLTALASLLAGVWAGWRSFHHSNSSIEFFLCALSIGLFVLSVYGFQLRVALVELTHCRGMLALEIARRKTPMPSPGS